MIKITSDIDLTEKIEGSWNVVFFLLSLFLLKTWKKKKHVFQIEMKISETIPIILIFFSRQHLNIKPVNKC